MLFFDMLEPVLAEPVALACVELAPMKLQLYCGHIHFALDMDAAAALVVVLVGDMVWGCNLVVQQQV